MAQLLNNGFVELVEFLGGDDAVIRNARRCYRSSSKGDDGDRRLVRHLIKANHRSPFEAMVFTFDVKTPLFVARQWFRHRMGSYNEESLRYCIALKDYFIPDDLSDDAHHRWVSHHEQAFALYDSLVEEEGLPKERARSVLPVGVYTRFYWTVNGSSLMNFLCLRLDAHAQAEIREYARAILGIVTEVAPVCFGEFAREVLSG